MTTVNKLAEHWPKGVERGWKGGGHRISVQAVGGGQNFNAQLQRGLAKFECNISVQRFAIVEVGTYQVRTFFGIPPLPAVNNDHSFMTCITAIMFC